MIHGVLFDLDGTLLDSASDLVAALNHVRASEGLPPATTEAFRRYASSGAEGLLRAGMPAAEDGVHERRKNAFISFYEGNSVIETRPFEGVKEMLEVLAGRAIPWGIVTNKIERLTLPILERTGLLAGAACVVCGDTLAVKKPHAAPVLLACELLRLEPSAVLVVGDDPRDIRSGQDAGAQTAYAAYGFVSGHISEKELNGSFILEQPRDLLELLDGLAGRPGSMHAHA